MSFSKGSTYSEERLWKICLNLRLASNVHSLGWRAVFHKLEVCWSQGILYKIKGKQCPCYSSWSYNMLTKIAQLLFYQYPSKVIFPYLEDNISLQLFFFFFLKPHSLFFFSFGEDKTLTKAVWPEKRAKVQWKSHNLIPWHILTCYLWVFCQKLFILAQESQERVLVFCNLYRRTCLEVELGKSYWNSNFLIPLATS